MQDTKPESDLGFSQVGGGGRIFQTFLFLRPHFDQIFEKTGQKRHFWYFFCKNLIKKLRFLGTIPRPFKTTKLTYISAKSAFRKNFHILAPKAPSEKTLGSVSQKGTSQNSTKRGSFGSAGGRILEKKASGHPPPPTLNLLVYPQGRV